MAGKTRSPNYPAIPLTQAVEVAGKIWNREKRTAIDHDTAAKAMGYKALSGPARTAIGALRQYGLIDKAEKGHIRLSDLAVQILHGSEAERAEALGKAAVSPTLFDELSKTHADASEQAIRSYLITRKSFIDDGATRAARAFRDAIQLVGKPASGYNTETSDDTPEDMPVTDTGQNQQSQPQKPGDGLFSLQVPFSKGTINVQVRVTGDAISPAHLARVRKYLKLAEEDWEGTATAKDEE